VLHRGRTHRSILLWAAIGGGAWLLVLLLVFKRPFSLGTGAPELCHAAFRARLSPNPLSRCGPGARLLQYTKTPAIERLGRTAETGHATRNAGLRALPARPSPLLTGIARGDVCGDKDRGHKAPTGTDSGGGKRGHRASQPAGRRRRRRRAPGAEVQAKGAAGGDLACKDQPRSVTLRLVCAHVFPVQIGQGGD
jgi:hypothetical protein